MSSAPFDFTPLLPAGLPPAARCNERVKFDFTGGNNDRPAPLDLIAAADAVLQPDRTLNLWTK
jgi:2-aminoadipate transaminase